MTYEEYLKNCTDEFEKTVIIVNLARSAGVSEAKYNSMSAVSKRRLIKELLSRNVPEENQNDI